MSLLAILIAGAAPATASLEPALPAARNQSTAVNVLAAPPDRVMDVMGGGKVALDIQEEESKLSLGYSWVKRTREPDENSVRLTHETRQVELTLPIGGSDSIIARSTIDALSNGPSISGSWTWFGTRSRDRIGSDRFQEMYRQAMAGCRADDTDELTPEDCERRRPRVEFVRRYSGLSEAQIMSALVSPAYATGMELSAGINTFDFRTPITLAENSLTKPQFAAKVYASVFPPTGRQAITGSIEYQNAFEAQDEKILCRDVVADPDEDCVRASPGAPANVEKLLLALDYRQVVGSLAGIGEVAISPKATYDALGDEFEIELPIYLKPRWNIGFLPGVTVTYNSEEDDVSVGVFLKRTFGF